MAASQWIYPPPASPSFFNSEYLNTNIVTFLNTSASFWPANGFGKSAAYDADAIFLKASYVPTSGQGYVRNLHCMPCRQKLESKDEALNWDACRYGIDDTLPELLTIIIPNLTPNPIYGNSSSYNINHAPSLPTSTKDQSLMCLFGVPDSKPYDMTLPFRFVNDVRQEATGDSMYIFNQTQPEGKPSSGQPGPGEQRPGEPTSESPAPSYSAAPMDTGSKISDGVIAGTVVGTVLGLLLLATAISCCIWKRKSNKKNAAVAGKGDLSKEEEAAGDALPSYESPPEYTQAVNAGAK